MSKYLYKAKRDATTSAIITLILLFLYGSYGSGQHTRSQELPDKVKIDWKSAGGLLMWAAPEGLDLIMDPRPIWSKIHCLPVFEFRKFDPESIQNLVAPNQPFGVAIHDANLQAIETLARFSNMEAVFIYDGDFGDNGFKHIAKLKKLRQLHMRYVAATNRCAEYLKDLTQLTHLALHCAEVNDDGAAIIASLPQLEWLRIGKGRLSNKGAAQILKMKKLKLLSLSDMDISDEVFANIQTLPDLQYLTMHKTKISDAAITKISALSNLRELWISDTQITNECGASLAKLQRLKRLDIAGTVVDDRVIEHLGQLKALEVLYIINTKITPQGVRRLKRLLPECSIIR